jgi:hypothetical protein
MPNERTIEAAANYALEKNARTIDLIVGYLNEASVLVLVFGILDTYSTGRLTWKVGGLVVGLAFVLFLAAMATRWVIFRFLKVVLRYSLRTLESHQERGVWR